MTIKIIHNFFRFLPIIIMEGVEDIRGDMKTEIINKIKVIRDRTQKERHERPSLQIPLPEPTDRDERSKDAPSKESRIIIIDLM